MYNNPAGPVAASAGLGGGGLALMSGSWTLLFVFIGAFAPRNAVAGRRTVKRYDFSAKQR
ncbi:hypothetical protein PACID_16470 [Acidipropionibacterium acidipropionici ATCC 4875]|uniref:Uncharacterized protein n=1 Tax=Acidipropionibacterium acidipropionici (strain ATCC 4875 / DSM 20272 / JCM 6432 / NBRC 12425 / NCIMB 8070 / 4) TaxID=1171373 RepID=K7RST3_ACIA4|nr:hypothetical protein [Acidipropionibacterium acidipropionici]AFV89456.1 hypothetical protein PACID_16470 [Acidipropionibacterium acidipropionici ATCC 4875]ALN16080.1 hypothetical protein ASQ49_13300 [Acidipropionibacterium acidipropionici]APZ08171.1 hypothetical protein BWX38_01585 [Acidipropionibacterium acidipropionici]